MFKAIVPFLLAAWLGCGDDGPRWAMVHENLDEALLFVGGSSSTDVWSVGGDKGEGLGPLVLHFDGEGWTRKATGASGDLWALACFADGTAYMGGEDGLILRYRGGAFEIMETPGTATVFGIWGQSPDDVWAVGGASGGAAGAFAWRLQGDIWTPVDGFPAELGAEEATWKVFGRAAGDVWIVGTHGITLHYDGQSFTSETSPTESALFTVHGNRDRMVAVGGFGTGVFIENSGDGWQDVTPPDSMQPIGVFMTDTGGYAVGADGSVWHRDADGWQAETTGLPIFDALHAVWVDETGGVWAVGGQVQAFPLIRGLMLYKGTEQIPGEIADET